MHKTQNGTNKQILTTYTSQAKTNERKK